MSKNQKYNNRKYNNDGDDSEDEFFVKYGTEIDSSSSASTFSRAHEQIAVDENGLKKFHGAFTGGFSAGYFNTVGSAEGWTPSNFVSSRSNRAKYTQQKPEDFMDREDLMVFNLKIVDYTNYSQTPSQQKGHIGSEIGQNSDLAIDISSIFSMFKIDNNFGFDPYSSSLTPVGTFGLGYNEKTLLSKGYNDIEDTLHSETKNKQKGSNSGPTLFKKKLKSKLDKSKKSKNNPKSSKVVRLSFLGDEDEDIFETNNNDKNLSNHRDINGTESSNPDILHPSKKKRVDIKNVETTKFSMRPSDDALKILELSSKDRKIKSKDIIDDSILTINKDIFIKSDTCFDGKVPIDGFVVINNLLINKFEYSDRVLVLSDDVAIPDSFNGSHKLEAGSFKTTEINNNQQISAVLNFEPENINMGEVINQKEKDKELDLLQHLRSLTKFDAENALKGFIPFSNDLEKQSRYKEFLNLVILQNTPVESFESILGSSVPELSNFYQAAKVFKPLSSTMSKRFTTPSDSKSYLESNNVDTLNYGKTSSSVDFNINSDSRQQAAKLDMYGTLTRIESHWIPTNLLCRRMNIANPYSNNNYNESKVNKSEIQLLEKVNADSWKKSGSDFNNYELQGYENNNNSTNTLHNSKHSQHKLYPGKESAVSTRELNPADSYRSESNTTEVPSTNNAGTLSLINDTPATSLFDDIFGDSE
ncbi:G patch domain-containing protein 1-like protein [Smittium culicis]|uniref:G patch domain-containing protein 1-like protein n=1 Tax=Smittium culicis TaxID=133412 RepID=A0A1R1X5Q7_9FUNG|nr:G patch domain-containing protein 1-like protein [Smittium culicis]